MKFDHWAAANHVNQTHDRRDVNSPCCCPPQPFILSHDLSTLTLEAPNLWNEYCCLWTLPNTTLWCVSFSGFYTVLISCIFEPYNITSIPFYHKCLPFNSKQCYSVPIENTATHQCLFTYEDTICIPVSCWGLTFAPISLFMRYPFAWYEHHPYSIFPPCAEKGFLIGWRLVGKNGKTRSDF